MKGAKAKNRPLSVESRRAKWRARHDLNVRSSESESDALSTRPRALTTSNYTADGEKRQVGIAAGGKFNLWPGVLAGLPGKVRRDDLRPDGSGIETGILDDGPVRIGCAGRLLNRKSICFNGRVLWKIQGGRRVHCAGAKSGGEAGLPVSGEAAVHVRNAARRDRSRRRRQISGDRRGGMAFALARVGDDCELLFCGAGASVKKTKCR